MKLRSAIIVLGLAAVVPLRVLGCAACFGRSDSALAAGMNYGIFSLLVVSTTMLGLIATFFVYIVRRAGQMPDAPLPEPTAVPES